MKVDYVIPKIKENVLKVFSNNKVIIENYNLMTFLSSEKIILRKYEIVGKNLIIKRMDGYLIEIEGEISKINFI